MLTFCQHEHDMLTDLLSNFTAENINILLTDMLTHMLTDMLTYLTEMLTDLLTDLLTFA